MTRAASCRPSAPLAQAAATSPTEWPTTADGVRPCAASASVSATCTAKRSGWAISVRSISVSRSSENSIVTSDQPDSDMK